MSPIESLVRPEILSMKAYQSARGSAGADGILLNANEAPYALLQKSGYEDLNRYPVPQPADLRSRLAALYKVDETQLLITRGSDEGIDLLTRVFCRPGKDAIVVCPPCFGMYSIAATIQGAAIVDVPRTVDQEWQIDIESLCQTITERPDVRLVFLTTPNNPTGDLISFENLEKILTACGRHALVVLDEAYIEFCDADSATKLLDVWLNLVVLRTLSKAWGAAGLRCGSVLANPEIIGLLQRVMAPYPLCAPAIEAAMEVTSPQVLETQKRMLLEVSKAKSDLLNFLKNCDWVETIWPGEANFVLLRVDNAETLTDFCAEQGVRIRDFSQQAMLERCVRISIGCEDDMTKLKTALVAYGERT
ncbi:MAG: histidinol-phosphate aminotransferase [Lysobacterales bacterium]|jgi:histidinol-phosphate aminotransferase